MTEGVHHPLYYIHSIAEGGIFSNEYIALSALGSE